MSITTEQYQIRYLPAQDVFSMYVFALRKCLIVSHLAGIDDYISSAIESAKQNKKGK